MINAPVVVEHLCEIFDYIAKPYDGEPAIQKEDLARSGYGKTAGEKDISREMVPESGDNGLLISLMQNDGSIKSIEQVELEAMKLVLDYYEANITKASKALGMAKSTFYRKMEK